MSLAFHDLSFSTSKTHQTDILCHSFDPKTSVIVLNLKVTFLIIDFVLTQFVLFPQRGASFTFSLLAPSDSVQSSCYCPERPAGVAAVPLDQGVPQSDTHLRARG